VHKIWPVAAVPATARDHGRDVALDLRPLAKRRSIGAPARRRRAIGRINWSWIADEECLVQLGRIARTEPALSDSALNALDGIDQSRANAIATSIRKVLPPYAKSGAIG
jgi:hypothetical protein